MRILYLMLFFLIQLQLVVFGQKEVDCGPRFRLLQQAERNFCAGDTNQTIKTLEEYISQYSDDYAILMLSQRLAHLYVAKLKINAAIDLLTQTLKANLASGCGVLEVQCGLYDLSELSSSRADICVMLSKIYDSIAQHETAMHYLHLADTKYLPSFGGCANGMIMYETKLSLDIADHYLTTSDTAKAIDRLLLYFLSNEHYEAEVTQKLKSILLRSYSQAQLSTEILNGIHSMRYIKKTDLDGYVLLTFLGRTIKKDAYENFNTSKDYYLKHKNILTLTR